MSARATAVSRALPRGSELPSGTADRCVTVTSVASALAAPPPDPPAGPAAHPPESANAPRRGRTAMRTEQQPKASHRRAVAAQPAGAEEGPPRAAPPAWAHNSRTAARIRLPLGAGHRCTCAHRSTATPGSSTSSASPAPPRAPATPSPTSSSACSAPAPVCRFSLVAPAMAAAASDSFAPHHSPAAIQPRASPARRDEDPGSLVALPGRSRPEARPEISV